jgi:hypothetical protein
VTGTEDESFLIVDVVESSSVGFGEGVVWVSLRPVCVDHRSLVYLSAWFEVKLQWGCGSNRF